jgi:transposase
MSLHPRYVSDIPEETARIAKAAFRKGNPYMTMRDELGTFFTDDQFVDLYPLDGQPAFSPCRLALVCVMQFAENLTDRQAADAVRARIDLEVCFELGIRK